VLHEVVLGQPGETVLIDVEVRQGGTGRCLFQKGADRFALGRRERGDDVAAALGRVAVGQPSNGIKEIGGPEQFGLDELVRKGLAAKGDPREVVTDEQAPYYGVRLSKWTLVPGPDALLGEITFDKWLAQQ
jgi:uncharacterized protein YbjT (DUF2867 family)